MSFNNNINVAGNGTFRDAVAATLTAAGLTRVTQGYAASATLTWDVWKSAAAGNAAGQDWYLFVGDNLSAGNRSAVFTVAEGWDDPSKLVTKYIPTSNNVAPAADYSIGAVGVAPTATNVFTLSAIAWASGTGIGPIIMSATTDRVIVRFPDASNNAFYLGQADRTYPTAVDPVQPLVCMSFLGDSSQTPRSGCTRTPGQTAAHAMNWRTQLWTNAVSSNSYFRMLWAFTDGVLAKPFAAPVAIADCRFFNNSWRAILKDVRASVGVPALGDVMTETAPDGSTVSYWCLSSNLALWAQSL